MVQEVPGSIPGKGFYVGIFVVVVVVVVFLLLLSKNTLFVSKLYNFFCNVNLFVTLNNMQNM